MAISVTLTQETGLSLAHFFDPQAALGRLTFTPTLLMLSIDRRNMRTIVNRPQTEHSTQIGEIMETKFPSRREFGRFLDQLVARTRRPRRRRRS